MTFKKRKMLINPMVANDYPDLKVCVEQTLWQDPETEDFLSVFFSQSDEEVIFRDYNIFEHISELVMADKRKIYVWDEMSKISEMSYLKSQAPLSHPVVDLCCGYGYWISKTLTRIDLGIDMFPDHGRFKRSIEGMRDNSFSDNTYMSVMAHDVTMPLPVPDKSVSTVTCICSLEHIADYTSVLREVRRILKPGGRIVLTVDSCLVTEVLKEVFSKEYSEQFIGEHQLETLLSATQWQEILKENGFTVIDKKGYINRQLTYLYLATFYPSDFTSYWTTMGFTELFKKHASVRSVWNTIILPALTEPIDPDEAMIVGLTATLDE